MSRKEQEQTTQIEREATAAPKDIMAAADEVENLVSVFGKGLTSEIRSTRPTDAIFKSASLRRRIATLVSVKGGVLKLALTNEAGETLSEHEVRRESAQADYVALWRAADAARNITAKVQKNGVVKYGAGIAVLN